LSVLNLVSDFVKCNHPIVLWDFSGFNARYQKCPSLPDVPDNATIITCMCCCTICGWVHVYVWRMRFDKIENCQCCQIKIYFKVHIPQRKENKSTKQDFVSILKLAMSISYTECAFSTLCCRYIEYHFQIHKITLVNRDPNHRSHWGQSVKNCWLMLPKTEKLPKITELVLLFKVKQLQA
jgi:hypothetical protein